MFPDALQRTLFGLVCGQLTLIGYLITRRFYSQPIFLLPLPLATVWGMRYFDQVNLYSMLPTIVLLPFFSVLMSLLCNFMGEALCR